MKILNKKITKLTIVAGLFAAALVQSMTAQATVTIITFDRLPSSWETGPVNSVTDSGFTVEATSSAFFVSTGFGSDCTPECVEKDSPFIATQSGGEAFVMHKNDAGLFDLHSFEYAERRVGGSYAPQIHVTGYVLDGSVVMADVILDGINDGSGPLNDFQTAVLPDTFRNLTSIKFASDGYLEVFSLDTIVVNELSAENIHPTACEETYPVISLVTTGGGQSAAVNDQVQLRFTGQITTEAGLTSGGKNTVTICPGTRVDYEVISTLGTAVCTLNGTPLQPTGQLGDGQQITCSNKPDGSDTDRFTIKGGM